jgi:hypothetical protein
VLRETWRARRAMMDELCHLTCGAELPASVSEGERRPGSKGSPFVAAPFPVLLARTNMKMEPPPASRRHTATWAVIRVTSLVDLLVRASQATLTGDPWVGATALTTSTQWGHDWSSRADCHAGVLADHPTPVGSAPFACFSLSCPIIPDLARLSRWCARSWFQPHQHLHPLVGKLATLGCPLAAAVGRRRRTCRPRLSTA